MTREEIESLSRISKRLVEEKDPDQFTNLVRQLDDLLEKDQNSREQNGKLTPRNTRQPPESFSARKRAACISGCTASASEGLSDGA
jgi:hypothetical protein